MASSSEASEVKQHHDDSAIQLDEEHPVDLSVWMSQYTYYYEEHVKGIVTLKVKDVNEHAARVTVYMKCVGCHIVIGEAMTELYRDSKIILTGQPVTSGAGAVEMRFMFTLPDRDRAFLPSFSLGNRRVTWFVYATVELESGAMYRTTFAQGQFRLGVVYKPVQAFHPRVFSRIKSLLRTSKQVQASLQRPVFMTSEPIVVKLSASVPSKEIHGVKVHVVQDVQFGRNERPLRNIVSLGSQEELQLKDQEVTVEQFEITLCASKGVAVVEDISFRDQKITELAPTMTIEKDGVQYVSIRYRLFVEMTVGRMVRQYMVLHIPFVLTDLSPPPDMLTHIVQLDPPLDQLPSYGDVPSQSKTGRPHNVAPHLDSLEKRSSTAPSPSINRRFVFNRSLSSQSSPKEGRARTGSSVSQASLHYDIANSDWEGDSPKGKGRVDHVGDFDEPPSYDEIVLHST